MRIFSVVTHTTPNNAKNASLQLGGTFMATLSQVCQSIFSLVSRLIASCITVLVTATHLPQFFQWRNGRKASNHQDDHGDVNGGCIKFVQVYE
jgi:hypothetical protein